jgi:hypothetical protein
LLLRSLCAVHCHRAVPSIIIEETSIAIPQHRPSPSIHPLLSSCCRAVHRCPLPSITIDYIAIESPSSQVEMPLRCLLLSLISSRLSPSNCQCAIHRPSQSSVHHRRAVNCCCTVNCCRAVQHCRSLNCCLLTMWYGSTV